MSLFYQEKITRNKTSYITSLVFFGVALLVIEKNISNSTNLSCTRLMEGTHGEFFIFIGFLLLRSSKRCFKYSLVENELIIREEHAGNFKIQGRISLDAIQAFKTARWRDKLKFIHNDSSCLFCESWKLSYLEGGKQKTLMLRPSKRLISSIQKEIGQTGTISKTA